MKRIILSIIVIAGALQTSFGQELIGTLQPIMEQDCVNLVLDFSGAQIMGMTEAQFRLFEEDWIKDQSDIYTEFRDEINRILKGKMVVGNLESAELMLRFDVIDVAKRGAMRGNLYLIKNGQNNEQDVIGRIDGLDSNMRGSFSGTKLRIIKLGAGQMGRRIGNILLKEYKRKK